MQELLERDPRWAMAKPEEGARGMFSADRMAQVAQPSRSQQIETAGAEVQQLTLMIVAAVLRWGSRP